MREESLRTELRRLNSEHPELTYFDVRDRVMKLMSKPPVKQSTLVQETAAAGQDIHSILTQQSQQIAAQQKQNKRAIHYVMYAHVWPFGPRAHVSA